MINKTFLNNKKLSLAREQYEISLLEFTCERIKSVLTDLELVKEDLTLVFNFYTNEIDVDFIVVEKGKLSEYAIDLIKQRVYHKHIADCWFDHVRIVTNNGNIEFTS